MFDIVGVGRHLRMRTLVTPRGRLTLYDGSEHGELFDLVADPLELENLFATPKGRELRTHLTEKLAQRIMETADASPRPRFMA